MPSQVPATEPRESMSTQLTQSSCSKLASYNGGIKLRTYCKLRVVSEDNPFAVRYSSGVVRRKVPLMRKSKGIGAGVSSMDSELRIWERPYRRTSTNHQQSCLCLSDSSLLTGGDEKLSLPFWEFNVRRIGYEVDLDLPLSAAGCAAFCHCDIHGDLGDFVRRGGV